MEGGGLAMLKVVLPHVPGLSYAALQHTLGRTETSAYWDLRTEMTVATLRRFMSAKSGKVPPLSKVQAMSRQDRPIKGKIWVAKATFPPLAADDTVRQAIFKAIDDMKDGEVSYTQPESAEIPLEWVGHRPDAGKDDPLPKISETEKYSRLMSEPTRTSNTTILYLHGGAYYLCGTSTHRPMAATLAKACKGRVALIDYRLAPQTAFPGQLLDAFTSYLTLLYPPEGSLHEAVPAEHIVLAGDSAGGNLSFALLQLLLQLHRSSEGVPVVRFHGRDVEVPLPAGATANSGWFDISRSLPSLDTNASFDILPPAKDDGISAFPKDDIWPADPPRGDIFCDLSLLDHPLVSPVMAEDWSAAPPLWYCVGREMLHDEVVAVAQRTVEQGVTVQFEMYEAMPHCFQLLMPWRANSERCISNWGDFARRCVEEPSTLKTSGVEIMAKGGADKPVDLSTIDKVGLQEVKRRVQDTKRRRLLGYEGEAKSLPKPAL